MTPRQRAFFRALGYMVPVFYNSKVVLGPLEGFIVIPLLAFLLTLPSNLVAMWVTYSWLGDNPCLCTSSEHAMRDTVT